MGANDVTINIRTRGSRQAARDTDSVKRSIGGLGSSARTARGDVGALAREFTGLGRSGFRGLSTAAKGAGIAVGGIGALAISSGLQFNAMQEQSEVAFTGLLGSAGAARKEMGFLQRAAANTPFELPQITQAARQLLAFGFPLQQANSLLGTMGDAAAGAGLGADAIDTMVRAMGQIRGKGTLQAEELQQLGELGLINRSKLARNLGVTTAQLADAGTQGIGADRAISALQKTLDDTFSGASVKQAATYTGQLSTLKDNMNATMGTITRPAFNRLRNQVFPVLNDLAKRTNQIWSGDATTGQKLDLTGTAIRHRLGPFATEFGAAMREAHIGQRIGDAIEAGAPAIGQAMGRAAPVAARSFLVAFRESGPWGWALTAAFMAAKFGPAFNGGATLLAAAFGRRFRGGLARQAAPGGPMVATGGRLGTAIGAMAGITAAAAVGVAIGAEIDKWAKQHGFTVNRPGSEPHKKYGKTTGILEPWVRRNVPGANSLYGGVLDRGSRGPGPKTAARSTGGPFGGHAKPVVAFPARVSERPIHTHVHLNGREIGQAVHREARDAQARRRGAG